MGKKSKFQFVDSLPPRVGGKSNRYAYAIRTLHKNPDRWALVDSYQKDNEGSYIVRTLRAHGLQVSVRKASGGWTRVYARYNSKKKAKA